MIRLESKVAIVTNMDQCSNRMIAMELAKLGVKLLLTGDKEQNVSKMVTDIVKNGGHAIGISKGDVVQTAILQHGRVDLLVVYVTYPDTSCYSNISAKDWLKLFSKNFIENFAIVKNAWPYMEKQKFGRILFTTSRAKSAGKHGENSVAAAQSAILAFAKTHFNGNKSANIIYNTFVQVYNDIDNDDTKAQSKKDNIITMATLLLHDSVKQNAQMFEIADGWYRKVPTTEINANIKDYKKGRISRRSASNTATPEIDNGNLGCLVEPTLTTKRLLNTVLNGENKKESSQDQNNGESTSKAIEFEKNVPKLYIGNVDMDVRSVITVQEETFFTILEGFLIGEKIAMTDSIKSVLIENIKCILSIGKRKS
ncbi:unnamed protein product [Caenorhabditis bovis]|uniref:Uncharacterized protein n=1 Tax=Caenorhabditis bovis TaxID=2654633 RepID=A0A8S1F8P9_9PELO|nr:unnamed protein product [Caenorhabditis bovis]